MNASRSGRRQADAQTPSELRITAGGERRRFLMADLDHFDLVLARAQRLKDAVDPIPRQAEDRVDSPIDESLHQHLCYCIRHVVLLPCDQRAAWTRLAASVLVVGCE